MKPLGTVPYLNARPLVAGLEPALSSTLVEAVPSELARRLAAGDLSAALVSSVVPLSDPGLCVLPAGYAMWAAPRDGDEETLSDALSASAAWGVAHRREIADREAPGLGLPADLCYTYLTENIRYDLGVREWEGLRLFHRLSVEMG